MSGHLCFLVTSRLVAIRQVASKLAPGGPLFLVGDENSSDFLLGLNDGVFDTASGVAIVTTCAQASGYSGEESSRTSMVGMNVPTLVLELCSSDSASRIWRNNPNIVAVQVNGGKSSSKDSWIASCVVDFVESALLLRDWTLDPNVQARL
jgi:hypothetical protein